jgi:peptidoglycan/LPS O-acetylase OafA/YrhL
LKFKKIIIVFLLLAAFLISIFVSEYFIDDKPVAVFFLTPFRIWELLAGVLLAFNIIPKINNRFVNEFLSLSCLIMIIYPCFYYNNLTIFPGISALIPVLGTVLLIDLGKNGKTIIIFLNFNLYKKNNMNGNKT